MLTAVKERAVNPPSNSQTGGFYEAALYTTDDLGEPDELVIVKRTRHNEVYFSIDDGIRRGQEYILLSRYMVISETGDTDASDWFVTHKGVVVP